MGAPSDRQADTRVVPRIFAFLGAILLAGTCLATCTVTPESAAPTGTPLAEPSVPLAEPSTPLAEPSVPLPLPTGTEAPFLVPAFDGPEPQPVTDPRLVEFLDPGELKPTAERSPPGRAARADAP